MRPPPADAAPAAPHGPRIAAGRLAAALAVLALGISVLAAGSEEAPALDPVAALNEGNQLFRNGQIEAAAEAYRAGWDPRAAHPTLAYNLGTALHNLDRLPEAILWYRRAGAADDPWVADNLWLARRTLGSQTLAAGGLDGFLARFGDGLRIAGIALAWLAVLLLIALPRVPAWVVVALAVSAAALYGAAAAGARWGSQPAVLLSDCSTAAGDLPAGTEAWARRLADGRWRIAARSADAVCPADAVAPVGAGA